MAEPTPGKLVRRAFVKQVLRRTLALIALASLIYGLAAAVYATRTIFKVKMNYAMVLERLNGERIAVTDVGWHARLPFVTRIEQEVTLMNQRLFLGGTVEPMRIISKENVALWTSAVLTFRIRDLHTWAIENKDAMSILQGDYDAIVKDTLQAKEVNRLISDRESIKEEIFTALASRPINTGGPTLAGKYGIEVAGRSHRHGPARLSGPAKMGLGLREEPKRPEHRGDSEYLVSPVADPAHAVTGRWRKSWREG